MDFKKLKGLFVENADDTVKQVPKSEKANVSSFVNKQEQPAGKTVVENKVDEKILDSLIKAIEKNNLPGEDYLEFMEALKAMQNLNLDDKIKFQTVMATLSTKGLTKEKITESASYYLKILESEKDKFFATVAGETKNQVEKRETDIKDLESANIAKTEEIKKLTVEINKNLEQINTIKKQIEEAKSKIDNAQSRFYTAFNFIKDQINNNIDKIKTI